MRKKAIIIGCDGQDGKILTELLVKKGYEIIGVDKTASGEKTKVKNFKRISVDITNSKKVFALIKENRPQEIYHLAAFHHSSQDKPINDVVLLKKSFDTNVLSLVNFLEGVKRFSPKSKIFYASSSLVFGYTDTIQQSEKTRFDPDTIYGITKADGTYFCRLYRQNYNIFASVGIFYNHESKYRKEQFLSQKIISTALRIKRGEMDLLELGDLKSEVDWGYAPDYMEAVHKIMRLKNPDDFIVATGKKHSVLDFVKIVFDNLGLDWKKHVKENSKVITRKRKALAGNYRKLGKATNWKPKTSFKQMIKILIDEQNLQKR